MIRNAWDRLGGWWRRWRRGAGTHEADRMARPLRGYRLLRWPELPDEQHHARMLGALSVMSSRPVTDAWFARQVGWARDEASAFLEGLADQGCAQRLGWKGGPASLPSDLTPPGGS